MSGISGRVAHTRAAQQDYSSLPDFNMSDRLFARFSVFIEEHAGIKMPPSKKTMLEGRLRKRIRALGLVTCEAYAEHVFSDEGMRGEVVHLIDAVTTNKTDFFREPAHFTCLRDEVLPQFIKDSRHCSRADLKLWSAGCSTGEEPYTLAMVLNEFAEAEPRFRYSILATDLSTRVLDKAARAIYEVEKVRPVPPAFKHKYLRRGKGDKSHLVRVVPELRQMVRFARLNFMQPDFGFTDKFHIIFCRNVIIYFDRTRQEQLLNKFCRHLLPGGYVFMGHSETLSGLNVPLTPVSTTVYRKNN